MHNGLFYERFGRDNIEKKNGSSVKNRLCITIETQWYLNRMDSIHTRYLNEKTQQQQQQNLNLIESNIRNQYR